MTRFRVILNRWITVLALGAVAGVLWVLLDPPIDRIASPVVDRIAEIPIKTTAAATAILIAGMCWKYRQGCWRSLLQLRNVAAYPPTWIASVFALSIIETGRPARWNWASFIEGIWWLGVQVPPWIWIVIIFFFALTRFVDGRQSVLPVKAMPGGACDNENESLIKLVAWLRDDREIAYPHEDRFGHDDVARRIVNRLVSRGESPTMTVIGPLGSGKSTIRALVEYRLRKHRSVEMVSVSLWTFDSTEAAMAGILRAVVRALGRHADALRISGLSAEYIALIERTDGQFSALAPFLRGEPTPEAILSRLSEIATAIGIKLVIWIEDMERFIGTDRLPPEDVVIRDVEPIRSLLFLLDRCDSISVITSDISLRSRMDVGKIARFVERPPRVTPESAWRQIAILRSACLDQDFIDPADEEYRKTLTPPEDDASWPWWFWSVHDSEPRVQSAIALVLDSPRSFKSALRYTWETWERLRGEIDFDSVLVASALRVARPDIFALIDEHVDLFRHGFRDPFADSHEERAKHPVQQQIHALLDKEDNDRLRNAVKAMISFVFPAAFRNHESEYEYIGCPQGLSVVRHVDYWRRYLTLPDIEDQHSDQVTLRAIAAWKAGRENDLVLRLVDPEQAGQIETFVGQFSPADLCRLLTETAEALRHESARTWEIGWHAPGITSVWRMMHRRRPPVELLGDTVCRMVADLATHHLPLAKNIYYFFAHDERSSVPSLLDDTQRNRVRAALREGLVGTYGAGSGKQLLQALHNGSPWVVSFLCMVAATESTDAPLFDGWDGMSTSILEAAEHDPAVGVALTIPFFTSLELVTDYRPSDETGVPQPVREYATRVDLDRMRRLFDFDRLAPLLIETPPAEGLDPQMRAMYEAAQTAAAEALRSSRAPADAEPDGPKGEDVAS